MKDNRYKKIINFYKTATNKIVKISRILPGGFDGNYSSSSSVSSTLKKEVSNIFKVNQKSKNQSKKVQPKPSDSNLVEWDTGGQSLEDHKAYSDFDYIPQATEGIPYDLHLYIMDSSFLSSEKHGVNGRNAALLFIYNIFNPRVQARFERIQLRVTSNNFSFSKKDFENKINNSIEDLKGYSSEYNKKLEEDPNIEYPDYLYQLNEDQMYVVDHLLSSIKDSTAPFFLFIYDSESHESYGFSEIKHDIMHILKDGDIIQKRPSYIMETPHREYIRRTKFQGSDFSNRIFRMKYWPVESFYSKMQVALEKTIKESSGRRSKYKLTQKIVKNFKDMSKKNQYTFKLYEDLKNSNLSKLDRDAKKEELDEAMRTTAFLILSSYLEGSYTTEEEGRGVKKSFAEVFNLGGKARKGRFRVFNEDMYHDFLAEKFFAKGIGVSDDKDKVRSVILKNLKSVHSKRRQLRRFLKTLIEDNNKWDELHKDFLKKTKNYLNEINEEKRNTIYKMFFLVKPSLGKDDFISANHVNFYSLNKLSNLKKLYDYAMFHFREEIIKMEKGKKQLGIAIRKAKMDGNKKIEKEKKIEHENTDKYIKFIKENYIKKLKEQYREIKRIDFSVDLNKEAEYVDDANDELKEKIKNVKKERLFLEKNINADINYKGKKLTLLDFLYQSFKREDKRLKVANTKVLFGIKNLAESQDLDNHILKSFLGKKSGRPNRDEKQKIEIIKNNIDEIRNMINYYFSNIYSINDNHNLFFKFYSGKDIGTDIGEESKFTINSLSSNYDRKINQINNIISNNNLNKQILSNYGQREDNFNLKIKNIKFSFLLNYLNKNNQKYIKPFVDTCIDFFSLEKLFKKVILNRTYESSLETSERDKKIYEEDRIVAALEEKLPESKISFYHNQDNLDKEHRKKFYQESFRRIRIENIKEELDKLYQKINKAEDESLFDSLYSEINNLEEEKGDLERIAEIKEELEELYQDVEGDDNSFDELKEEIENLKKEKDELEKFRFVKRTGFRELKENVGKSAYKDTNHENKIKDLSSKVFVFMRIAAGFEKGADLPASQMGLKEKMLSESLLGKDDKPGSVQLGVQELAKKKEKEEAKRKAEEEKHINKLKLLCKKGNKEACAELNDLLFGIFPEETPEETSEEIPEEIKEEATEEASARKKESSIRSFKIFNIYKNI